MYLEMRAYAELCAISVGEAGASWCHFQTSTYLNAANTRHTARLARDISYTLALGLSPRAPTNLFSRPGRNPFIQRLIAPCSITHLSHQSKVGRARANSSPGDGDVRRS